MAPPGARISVDATAVNQKPGKTLSGNFDVSLRHQAPDRLPQIFIGKLALEIFRRNFSREFFRVVFARPLSDVRVIDPPIEYKQPGGGSWVTLSPTNVPEFTRLQEI